MLSDVLISECACLEGASASALANTRALLSAEAVGGALLCVEMATDTRSIASNSDAP